MRRLPASIGLGGLAALLILGVVLASTTVVVPVRILAAAHLRLLHGVSHAVAASGWLVPAAHAEDLQFKPVPSESLSRFERMRVVKRRPAAETATPEAPAAPETPPSSGDVEVVLPEVPDAPKIVVGKSGSVMRIGSDIRVGPNEVVKGDLSSMGGDITIEGHVEGDVVAMRGDVHLFPTARVDGDVVCIGGTLTEDPGAHVGGQRVTAIGDGSRSDRDDEEPRHDRRDRSGHRVSYALTWLIILLGIGWAVTRFAPGSTRAAIEVARTKTAMSFGIGAVVWALLIPSVVALALIVALLCITIIGIPLALAALLGYVLFIILVCGWGYIVGAALVGERISRRGSGVAGTAALAPGTVTLTGQVMRGVLVVSGAAVAGQLLRYIGSGTPLAGLGLMIWIVAFVASAALTTLGAGAWLNAEFTTGTLGRWWAGRRGRFGNGKPGGAPPSGGTPPPPADPQPPPAPPTSMTPYESSPRQSSGFGTSTTETPSPPPAAPSPYAPPPEPPPAA